MKPIKLILIVLLVVCFTTGLSTIENDKNVVLSQLTNIENEFGGSLITSFYSISELRSFSLIQLDKTMVDYEHRWKTPEDISLYLSKKEKLVLKTAVADYLSSLEPEQKNRIISKIKSWCLVNKMVQMLFTSYGINMDEFLRTSDKNFYTQTYAISGQNSKESTISNMSELEKNKMYHLVINEIASLDRKKQFDYFGMMFKSLAENIKE